MNANKTPHEWSKKSLLDKAQRYATLMLEQDRESWQFGFWSALTLEMLTRASLANVSPTLVAESKDWNNTFYALGHQPTIPKFTPKSAAISELLKRARSIFPEFTQEMLNFSVLHIDRRNSEVHGGAMPFDGLRESQWLAEFYSSCEALLGTLEKSLKFLFGTDEAEAAQTLIAGLKDGAAKSVKKTIEAHKTIWDGKSKAERTKLAAQAEILADRHSGHRVKCPSCGSNALLHGNAIGAPKIEIQDQFVVEKKPMLPSGFECTACGLKVLGYSKLNASGLGDSFTLTSRYDVAEYFGASTEDEWMGMEEDNNEP